MADTMNFSIPPSLRAYLASLDTFIDSQITPLQNKDDNNRFFDHRREHSRTDWDAGGLPRPEWEALLSESRRLADEAGFYRLSLSKQYGGQASTDGRGSNLWMAVIREHLASKGLGLFNDLQNEHSMVGNFPDVVMLLHFGNEAQKEELIRGRLAGKVRITFGLTEPEHGSDATHMATRARPETREGVEGWVIDGAKKWQTGMHTATHCFIFARTAGKNGEAKGISCFIVPRNTEGVVVESYEWYVLLFLFIFFPVYFSSSTIPSPLYSHFPSILLTNTSHRTLNMPTDHATVSLTSVFVPASALLGPLHNGLGVAQAFVHENRIRQAASSLGAAVYCIQSSINYANARRPFGTPLSHNQGIQFPLVELHTQCEMLRLLIRKTAVEMDSMPHVEVEKKIGDKVSMCNYWANRLCTEAADRAIQVHGGNGYSRHWPFEHIWRHHRRYRITEGSEEIQMRKVAAYLFGFGGRKSLTDVPVARDEEEKAKKAML
jgi:alkylation response protein AidB-like acyl-CoA dehydrogenase